jgi:hypothetical protein
MIIRYALNEHFRMQPRFYYISFSKYGFQSVNIYSLPIVRVDYRSLIIAFINQ